MAALCQAVETKDLYTRGHRERVSRGAVMIGREIGMRASGWRLGKLGVPTTVLRKDGPLTEEEFAAIQLHPMRGLEIVQEIGFLGEALAGIMHGTRPGLPEQLQWRIPAAQRRHHRPVRHRSRPGAKPIALTGGTGTYRNIGGDGTLVEFGNGRGRLTHHILSLVARG